ncbi:MAG: hypothetical protein AAF202_06340, partial [Pseudomonadota bacterium]
MLRLLFALGLALSFAAEARIMNFRQYDVKSFSCGFAKRGKKNIASVVWDEESDQITVLTKDLSAAEDELYTETVYGVEKVFPASQTLMFIGRPADGSKGFIQVMLRDERPTTISLGAR